jgi:hypothetical protein
MGHMAVTPLQTDLTDHDSLKYWGQTAGTWTPLAALTAEGTATRPGR